MQKKKEPHTPTWRVFSTSSSLIAADNWPLETTGLHQRCCVSNRNIQTTGETHTTRHNKIDKATQGRKRTQFEWRREMNVKMGFGEILNLHILIGKSMLCTNRGKWETASPVLQNLCSGCLHHSLSLSEAVELACVNHNRPVFGGRLSSCCPPWSESLQRFHSKCHFFPTILKGFSLEGLEGWRNPMQCQSSCFSLDWRVASWSIQGQIHKWRHFFFFFFYKSDT